MAQTRWTKRSLRDLEKMDELISFDSVFYAERFIQKVISRVDQLIEFPESGRISDE